MGTSFFSRTTTLTPEGAGRYTGELDPGWNCPIVPQGGITTAVAARAMTMELGHEEQRLRSISSVFAAPVAAGPVQADVTVLRRGRSMSQCSVTVRNPDSAAGLTAIAVFGAQREGFEFTDLKVPDGIIPPDECRSFRDEPDDLPDDWEFREPFAFWEHVLGKPILGHAPWHDYEPETSLVAKWTRFDDPPRADDGTWDPLAVLALSDTMPGSVGEKLGPDHRDSPWLPPSADFTVHLFGDARCEWLLHVNRARHAGDGYASLDMETWDVEGPEPRLVCYATQMMFFSFPKD